MEFENAKLSIDDDAIDFENVDITPCGDQTFLMAREECDECGKLVRRKDLCIVLSTSAERTGKYCSECYEI
ncbi:hypothetical protein OSG_eHP15_00100 [environmental Halophage eHP-15]|nr:hypothetical protein OSG_eHP15_00100 [environmental Halophage eHP-15]